MWKSHWKGKVLMLLEVLLGCKSFWIRDAWRVLLGTSDCALRQKEEAGCLGDCSPSGRFS